MGLTFEPKTFTAVFPLVARAEAFVEAMTTKNWYVTNVVRKGRTVTFQTDRPTEPDYFADMVLTVGCYGSDQRRKATLNGVKAPMTY